MLKAGKLYVPLDPSYPQARIAYMLEDAQAGLLLSDRGNLSLAHELAGKERGVLDITGIDPHDSADNPGLAVTPDTLVYLFYTSGSTGQPKGVVDSHRNVLHNIRRYTNGLHIRAEDRLTLLQSCSFSGSVSSLFSALLNGAAVFPFNLPEEGVGRLGDWLIQERITIYHSVPMIFRNFLTGEQHFPHLRLIRLEGDQASRKDLELYREHFPPGCILVNGLGATETGIVRRYFIDHQTPVTGSLLPIGYPVEDMDVLLLDEGGEEVGFDCVGEIAVRSDYLAVGYWRRPDLTRAAFRPDPGGGSQRLYRTGDVGRLRSDGCLEHLGRKDFQAKVGGHRVEVAAVETALLDLGTVKEAVVMTREDRPGDQRLVAYLVPATKPAPTVRALRMALGELLPSYTIPSAYVMLDALPLNANGKVDRRALPAPNQTRPELDCPYAAPQSPVEEMLAEIWAEVLGVVPVGITDHFLDLGGTSLRAMQVLARLRQAFAVDLPVPTLFETPTIAGLAVIVVQRLAEQADPVELAAIRTEIAGPAAPAPGSPPSS